MVKDFSVEYAHIYTNQRISKEHQTSLQVLGELKASMERENKTSSLVVMVDDYSFPDPSFNYDEFSAWLETQGHGPDVLIRESQLIPLCDEVLKQIQDNNLKQQITDYIKTKKYPCSLFIAAWYLLRLGKLKSSIIPSTALANKIINILPESFKPFEDKGLEIIASTQHRESIQFIEYRFLPGRLIV